MLDINHFISNMNKYILGKEIFPNIFEIRDYPNIIAKKYNNSLRKKYEEKRLLKIQNVQYVPRILYTTQYMIYMRKIPGEDLFNIITRKKRLLENECKHITYKLLNIIKEIHHLGVIHGDIKPENIMYNESSQEVTLIDFEFRRHTENYRSPESYFQKNKTISEDIWCLGATIYTLLMGHNPYNSHEHLFSGLDYYPLDTKRLSINAIDFVQKLLTWESNKRPSVEECLDHDWFKSDTIVIIDYEPEPIIKKKCCVIL